MVFWTLLNLSLLWPLQVVITYLWTLFQCIYFLLFVLEFIAKLAFMQNFLIWSTDLGCDDSHFCPSWPVSNIRKLNPVIMQEMWFNFFNKKSSSYCISTHACFALPTLINYCFSISIDFATEIYI